MSDAEPNQIGTLWRERSAPWWMRFLPAWLQWASYEPSQKSGPVPSDWIADWQNPKWSPPSPWRFCPSNCRSFLAEPCARCAKLHREQSVLRDQTF